MMSMMSSPSKLPVCPRKVFFVTSWSSGRYSKPHVNRPYGRIPWHLRRDRPASERPRDLEDVLLSVVAHAHREQLEQLSSPVLVGCGPVVLVVVEPVDHGWVFGQPEEQLSIVSHPKLAEHLDLIQEVVAVVHLVVPGGEEVVPEQRHLLLERPPGVDQVVEPVRLTLRDVPPGDLHGRMVPVEEESVDRRLLRIQQVLDRLLVTVRNKLLELVPVDAESGSAHQVSHQRKIFFRRHSPDPPAAVL